MAASDQDIITVEAHADIYPETDEERSRAPNGSDYLFLIAGS